MRFVIQRVSEASVKVDEKVIGDIGNGLLVFIGVSEEDVNMDEKMRRDITDKLIRKTANMRIFCDENGKTNLSAGEVDGEFLLISQFTLYADCKKGNRPSFTKAGDPVVAEKVYEYIIDEFKKRFGSERVAIGSFGADMKVSLVNDGPFTVILDSDEVC